jgi:hypothetical protein
MLMDGIDGIIGLPLFKSLLVTFDYPNSHFKLSCAAALSTTAVRLVTTSRSGDAATSSKRNARDFIECLLPTNYEAVVKRS